ncbi:MAG: hypothetical protein H6744_07745 [Deltaproteobacteria bacterium]|nr:hypothetical protein [Deltaproteobacteria bacterium]
MGVLLMVALGGLAAGCGPEEEPAAERGAVAATVEPATTPAAAPRSAPATEEALLRAAADAIVARDLEALRDTAAPELAADLARLHENDAPVFWRRGDELVANVRSGVRLGRADEGAEPTSRWRVLVHFGNGVDETMVFTRLDGELRIDQL